LGIASMRWVACLFIFILVCSTIVEVAIIQKQIYPNPDIKKYFLKNKRITYFSYILDFYIEFGDLKILILFQILTTRKSKKYVKKKWIILYFCYVLDFYIEFGNLKILILLQNLATRKSKKHFFSHFEK
jgi:hypothetical protein